MANSTTGMHYTPTQQRMVDVLSDGMSHTREELHACLHDDLQPLSGIRAHLTAIRSKLRPVGSDIVCELRFSGATYRMVRLLASPYDGKR